ncbi:MAG: Cache type 2 domain-containing protein [candidate division TM6 bacterium GW2011_GWF2_32_72]|nr:MAG: Cache type 2 domain-containing protein [candidate division TM6 bacterium GW2011_GWF2_32_72]
MKKIAIILALFFVPSLILCSESPEQSTQLPQKEMVDEKSNEYLTQTPEIDTTKTDINLPEIPSAATKIIEIETPQESIAETQESPLEQTIEKTKEATTASEKITSEEIQITPKTQAVIDLVNNAVDYTISHSFTECMTYFRNLTNGDINLLVIDQKGTIFIDTNYPRRTWKNILEDQDSDGKYYTKEIINIASEKNEGWLTYRWAGMTKLSFVKKMIINNKMFIACSGVHPYTKKDATMNMVKSAIDYLQQHGKQETFNAISYPLGQFVEGDIKVEAFDLHGKCYASGYESSMIGADVIDRKDQNGVAYIQEYIKAVEQKNDKEGTWVKHMFNNAPKESYVVQTIDPRTNEAFILVSGYFPESTAEKVQDLVNAAVDYIQKNGLKNADKIFADVNKPFLFGDLYVFVQGLDGWGYACGQLSGYVNVNLLNNQNDELKKIITDINTTAENGGGWSGYQFQNGYKNSFISPVVDVEGKKVVVGVGYFPVSKETTSLILINKAAEYMKNHGKKAILRELVKDRGPFEIGDLFIFAFDFNGYCLAYNGYYDRIWKNFLDLKDKDGVDVIKEMIETAKKGDGWVKYKAGNLMRRIYVHPTGKFEDASQPFSTSPLMLAVSFYE